MIQPGWYKHHEGGFYRVLGITQHFVQYDDGEEEEHYLVVYEDSNGIRWARPLAMFCDQIKIGDKVIPKFIYIGERMPKVSSV